MLIDSTAQNARFYPLILRASCKRERRLGSAKWQHGSCLGLALSLKAAGLVNVSLSILFCQHDGDDPLGDGGISIIRRYDRGNLFISSWSRSVRRHRRRLRRGYPQEICPVSLRRLRMPRGILTAGQKSAEAVLGYVVGKASEALHAERRSQQIGRAGNGD